MVADGDKSGRRRLTFPKLEIVRLTITALDREAGTAVSNWQGGLTLQVCAWADRRLTIAPSLFLSATTLRQTPAKLIPGG